MLNFQQVRTARFTFTLAELTLGQIRALYDIHPHYLEKQRSHFIKAVLKEFHWHKGYEQNSLEDLTAQERLFIEGCYLSSVSDNPNFAISNGHYVDYLLVEKQFKQPNLKLGSIPNDEDIWFIQPLTGAMLEIIEERILAKQNYERLDWILYAMAAQLSRENETVPEIKADPLAYGDWLDERVERLMLLPESAVIHLIGLFFSGQEQLTHLFAINFDEGGVHITSSQTTTNEEGEEAPVLPARFRPYTKISVITQKLLGKFNEDV